MDRRRVLIALTLTLTLTLPLAPTAQGFTYSRGAVQHDLSEPRERIHDHGFLPPDHPDFFDATRRYERFLEQGVRQLRGGLKEAALESLIHAAGFRPYQPYVRRLLGHAHFVGGRYYEAVDQFLRMTHLSRNPYRLEIEFHRLYRDPHDYEHDKARLAAAIAAAPDDPVLSFLLGIYLYYDEDHEAALPHLERAVKLNPASSDYRNFLRYCRDHVKD